MPLGKLSFLHTLVLKTEVHINKNNYATMLFMSKQASLPKISLILRKMKICPKSHIGHFCAKSFNCFMVDNASVIFFFLATALSRVQGVEPRDFSPLQVKRL